MQIPRIISDLVPNFEFPKDFFGDTNPTTSCIYLASCLQDGFIYIDQSFYNISGYSPEIISKKGIDWWFSLIHPEDIDRMLHTTFQHCFLKPANKRLNKIFSVEYRIQKADGSWIWLSETKCVISLTESGKNNFILGRLENINDIKIQEQDQLKRLIKEEGECNYFLKAAIPAIDNVQKKQSGLFSVFEKRARQNSITRREKEILYLIGEGFSTKQIADKLYISVYTVETHRRNLLEKMQVKNSMQLIKLTANSF